MPEHAPSADAGALQHGSCNGMQVTARLRQLLGQLLDTRESKGTALFPLTGALLYEDRIPVQTRLIHSKAQRDQSIAE
jgi:hypothetical protein